VPPEEDQGTLTEEPAENAGRRAGEGNPDGSSGKQLGRIQLGIHGRGWRCPQVDQITGRAAHDELLARRLWESGSVKERWPA
jgi:hypothetical protein